MQYDNTKRNCLNEPDASLERQFNDDSLLAQSARRQGLEWLVSNWKVALVVLGGAMFIYLQSTGRQVTSGILQSIRYEKGDGTYELVYKPDTAKAQLRNNGHQVIYITNPRDEKGEPLQTGSYYDFVRKNRLSFFTGSYSVRTHPPNGSTH